jgi:hypothetical protein
MPLAVVHGPVTSQRLIDTIECIERVLELHPWWRQTAVPTEALDLLRELRFDAERYGVHAGGEGESR